MSAMVRRPSNGRPHRPLRSCRARQNGTVCLWPSWVSAPDRGSGPRQQLVELARGKVAPAAQHIAQGHEGRRARASHVAAVGGVGFSPSATSSLWSESKARCRRRVPPGLPTSGSMDLSKCSGGWAANGPAVASESSQ